MSFNNTEYADIQFIYGFCNVNSYEAVRECAWGFPNHRLPNNRTFIRVNRNLREFGTFTAPGDLRGRHQNVNDEVIRQVEENSSLSTRRISLLVQISKSAVSRVLKRNQYHPFHLQGVQELNESDHIQRLRFCQWFLEQQNRDDQFINKIIWTDEATFTRDGITNFHNQHIYSVENPHVVRERSFQHCFSVNV